MTLWHALISSLLIAFIVFGFQHFHVMANATRLNRSIALAVVVFVVLLVLGRVGI